MPPGWERLRRAVLNRDGGRCQLCGEPATDVDHVVSRADRGGEDMANLRALCAPCHRKRSAAQGGRATAQAWFSSSASSTTGRSSQ
jgi:5-methylcytosine-specific restriction endonuclease McrA